MTELISSQLPGIDVVPCRPHGPYGVVKAFLLYDADSLILVDSGASDADGDIVLDHIRRLGRKAGDVQMCIFTHQHGDHTKGFSRVQAEAKGDIPVACHTEDAEPVASRFAVTVARQLVDGDVLPGMGGISIIHTPGHTPGTIALHLPERRVLIAGDCLFSAGGWLIPSPSYLCTDSAQARASVQSLIDRKLDIEAILVGHGQDVLEGGGKKLDRVLQAARDAEAH